jgi:hypothetical protein
VVFLRQAAARDTTQPQRGRSPEPHGESHHPGAIVPDVADAARGDRGRHRRRPGAGAESDVDASCVRCSPGTRHARAIEIVRATLDDVLVALVAAETIDVLNGTHMSLGYVALDLRRVARAPSTLCSTAVLPAVLFLFRGDVPGVVHARFGGVRRRRAERRGGRGVGRDERRSPDSVRWWPTSAPRAGGAGCC